MKRLLLPLLAALALPTAVKANPFSNIVVKTDLGEKFIVKESTVYVLKNFNDKDLVNLITEKISKNNESRITTLTNAVQSLKNNMIRSDEKYQKCKKTNRLYKNIYPQSDCEYVYLSDEFVKDTQPRLDYVQKNLSDVEKEVEGLIDKETKDIYIGKHAVIVNFRPIFQDLNNQKQVLDYIDIICINPVLKEKNSNYWSEKYADYSFENTFLAIDIVKKKVCNKFAKFN